MERHINMLKTEHWELDNCFANSQNYLNYFKVMDYPYTLH